MAGKEVAKVVNKCEEAKETNTLDLSGCDLTQVPDAVFLLMRGTPLVTCDLSHNIIKTLPSKLPTNFTSLKELNLATNHLSNLPEEMRNLENLTKLVISYNQFSELPLVISRIDRLRVLSAEGNKIQEVDVERLKSLGNLSEIHLQENPLTLETKSQLLQLQNVTVLLTPQDPELDSVH